jgi:hypothetical protein
MRRDMRVAVRCQRSTWTSPWIAALCLAMPIHAGAAPTKTAKTELVAFDASPFPYSGQLPGHDKLFLDVDDNGRRGHTSVRGGVYWEDTTYSDRRALLYIPKGFDAARPAVMVIYFHGNQATLERDVAKRQAVPRQVAESGLNAVLVAPQLAVDALDSSAGQFYEAGAFRRFVEEAGVRLAKLHGGPRAKAALQSLPVVLVAYSGGYQPAAWAAHHGGIGDRLRGIILLDALYGEVDKFAGWIARRGSGIFVSAYSGSAREENLALQRRLADRDLDFASALPADRLAIGSVTFIGTADEVEHGDFVTRAWVDDPLKAVLGKVPGFSRRQAAPAAPRRK